MRRGFQFLKRKIQFVFKPSWGGLGGLGGFQEGLGGQFGSETLIGGQAGRIPVAHFRARASFGQVSLGQDRKTSKHLGKLPVPAWIWSSFGGVRLEKSGFEVHLGRMVWQASLPASALAGSIRRGGLLCPTTKCQRAGCSAIASDYDASFSALMLPHSSRL